MASCPRRRNASRTVPENSQPIITRTMKSLSCYCRRGCCQATRPDMSSCRTATSPSSSYASVVASGGTLPSETPCRTANKEGTFSGCTGAVAFYEALACRAAWLSQISFSTISLRDGGSDAHPFFCRGTSLNLIVSKYIRSSAGSRTVNASLTEPPHNAVAIRATLERVIPQSVVHHQPDFLVALICQPGRPPAALLVKHRPSPWTCGKPACSASGTSPSGWP